MLSDEWLKKKEEDEESMRKMMLKAFKDTYGWRRFFIREWWLFKLPFK